MEFEIFSDDSIELDTCQLTGHLNGRESMLIEALSSLSQSVGVCFNARLLSPNTVLSVGDIKRFLSLKDLADKYMELAEHITGGQSVRKD